MEANRKAFAAGAAAGTGAVLSTVLFYPVELVKNRLQAAMRGGAGFAYEGLTDGLVTIVREEGARGLFTGIGPIVIRAFGSDFFTVWFGDLLLITCRGLGGAAELPLRVVGGWGSVAITQPLETVSTRVTCTRPPLSVRAACLALWREGGLGAFWSGFRVMLVLCINPALTFTAFGWLRDLLAMAKRSLQGLRAGEEPPLTWLQSFLIGAVAKLVTMCSVYPLIRAKFLLQAGTCEGTELFEVLREVAVKEGARGLYRGLDAQLSKSILSTALSLMVKEQTEQWWRRFLLGAAGPGKAAAAPALKAAKAA